MRILTLTTDFGQVNGFVGTMKGVIWGINTNIQIADISHEIKPQNVLDGAIALWRAAPFFPPETVHVAVVDPGVGTHRRALAAQIGHQYYVLPDNGLITPMLLDGEESGQTIKLIHLTNPGYFLPRVSNTFHGRDVFAPVGAHLANGTPLEALGDVINDPVRLALPRPHPTHTGWRAHITVIDVFGNLTTDLHAKLLPAHADITFQVGGVSVHGLVESYGHRKPGEVIALIDSEDYIELAVVNGSAAAVLGASVGDVIEVTIKPHAQ